MDPEHTTQDTAQDTPSTLVAEDLVEEVSIDGMCGVY
jgi:mycofactocin precursor